MAGTQRLFNRLVQQTLGLEPATGTQIQTRQRFAGLAATQQVGEQVMVTKPVAVFVQGHQKHLMSLQKAQDVGAVLAVTQGIAERRAEALLARRVEEKSLYVRRQDFDDFFQQVVAYQPFAAVQGVGQGMLIA
ncbi:hypothetical protein D3C81_1316680 [compost metagenome]